MHLLCNAQIAQERWLSTAQQSAVLTSVATMFMALAARLLLVSGATVARVRLLTKELTPVRCCALTLATAPEPATA
jgi:hypothetical protein